jgi:y4mF family transcriptional regulator
VDDDVAAKQLQRSVRFPKPSNALRQYVAVAREKGAPITTVRLRADPPVSSPTPRLMTRTAIRRPRAPAAGPAGPDADALAPIRSIVQVGDIIRHVRRRQGLTQAELALMAGTGRRFVSDVEAGKPTVEFERLIKLCKTLGVRLFALEPDDDQ